MNIWIDFANTPHVNFLLPIIKNLKNKHKLFFTSRDFTETEALLSLHNINAISHGRHQGKNSFLKLTGLLSRDISLLQGLPHFDLSITVGGVFGLVSAIRGKPSICFGDNELAVKTWESQLANHYFFPKCVDKKELNKIGLTSKKRILYDGFKEDIYLADYIPDENFLNNLPFEDFITIRGEQVNAHYVPRGVKSLIPALFKIFSHFNFNVLYLPRNNSYKELASRYPNIFVPPAPLKGLDVCHYSQAVITGAGSFAREAACMGTPAVSFFAGRKLIAVDQLLVDNKKLFHSRNPLDIFRNVVNSKKTKLEISRSKEVQKEVFYKLNKIIERIENKNRSQ